MSVGKKEKINVLSLFDGMSCGQIALNKVGIEYENYYASEIDKHAITVTQTNFPNTIQLGDVTKVKIKLLCLSEVYSYLCDYDTNLQSKISEQEVLYWIDKEYTLSTNFGTQEQNERQALRQSSVLQRFEKIRFSKCGVGDIIKSCNIEGSRGDGDKVDSGNSFKLQCGEWWYGDDIQRGDTETNFARANRQTENSNLQSENISNIKGKISRRKRKDADFAKNKKSNVERRCKEKLFKQQEENKFNREVNKEESNGGVETDKIIADLIRKLQSWNETNGTSDNYRDFIRLHSQEQITVVEYGLGFYLFKGRIDLCIGGSPCQGFSFASKGLNFEDERSKLFFEFVRLIKECKPKYFLLENVKMKQEWQDIISKELGVKPVEICSSLFSAQQRKRLYWTNIPIDLSKLPNSNEVIADVLGLTIVNERKNKILMSKSDFKVSVRKNYIDKKELALFLRNYKTKTINEIATFCDAPKTMVEHWFRMDGSFSIPDVEYWDKLKQCLSIKDCKYDKAVTEFEIKNNSFDMAKRIYHIDGKHPTLTTLTRGGQRKTITDGKEMFYLNPNHCEKLQTVPLDYTKIATERQRFRMLGNGWTVDVIAFIFSFLKREEKFLNSFSNENV